MFMWMYRNKCIYKRIHHVTSWLMFSLYRCMLSQLVYGNISFLWLHFARQSRFPMKRCSYVDIFPIVRERSITFANLLRNRKNRSNPSFSPSVCVRPSLLFPQAGTHFSSLLTTHQRIIMAANRVIVYGGNGALGSKCVQHFKSKGWVSARKRAR